MSGLPSWKSAEIGLFCRFSAFFCPFADGPNSIWKIQKTEEKGRFPQISSDLLNPSLKPPICGSPRCSCPEVISGEVVRKTSSVQEDSFLRCFFRLTFHVKSPKPVFSDFNGFPPDPRRLFIHFDRFFVVLNQFQSASISFNQF